MRVHGAVSTTFFNYADVPSLFSVNCVIVFSTILSPDSLLTSLFPDDSGKKAPNPASLYQLAKVG